MNDNYNYQYILRTTNFFDKLKIDEYPISVMIKTSFFRNNLLKQPCQIKIYSLNVLTSGVLVLTR